MRGVWAIALVLAACVRCTDGSSVEDDNGTNSTNDTITVTGTSLTSTTLSTYTTSSTSATSTLSTSDTATRSSTTRSSTTSWTASSTSTLSVSTTTHSTTATTRTTSTGVTNTSTSSTRTTSFTSTLSTISTTSSTQTQTTSTGTSLTFTTKTDTFTASTTTFSNTSTTTTATNTTTSITETMTSTFTGTWFEIHAVVLLNLVTGNAYSLAEEPGANAAVADLMADQARAPRHLTTAVILPRPVMSATEEVSSTEGQMRTEIYEYRRDRQQARAVANELATAFESLSLVSLTQALNARLPSHRMSIYESQFGIDITAPDGSLEVFRALAATTSTLPQEPTGVSFAQPRARIASAVLCVAAAALA
mmetsp:Transcript_23269/g.54954  ORF Transcript_23269/g.54954 Transcript_23269/m.54954 type:complete len:364 (+) Transcript_23269:44-1135(+)